MDIPLDSQADLRLCVISHAPLILTPYALLHYNLLYDGGAFMKRVKNIFLCSFVLMLVFLVGCSAENEQTDITDVSDIISESFSSEGLYTDELGNTYNYSYHVPKLLINTPAAESLNDKISTRMMGTVEQELENMDMQCSLTVYKCGYAAYLNDHVLSLVMFIHTDFDYSEYFSVNVDIRNGREIPNEELLKIKGYSSEDFLKMQKNTLENGFFELYGKPEQDSETGIDSLYNELYSNTLSDDSLSDCFIYFGPGQELRLIGKIYSFAGADFYYYTLSAENGAELFATEEQTRIN